jgi:hypothetical protein
MIIIDFLPSGLADAGTGLDQLLQQLGLAFHHLLHSTGAGVKAEAIRPAPYFVQYIEVREGRNPVAMSAWTCVSFLQPICGGFDMPGGCRKTSLRLRPR